MSQEHVTKILIDLGLTQKDSEVYIFLAKKGSMKARDILKALGMNKVQLYRSLKNLQNKGMVESTLEFPARFTAVSFEKVLDLFIKAKKDEAQNIEKNRNAMLSHWRSFDIAETAAPSDRFMVIEGRSYIYAKIFQMVKETKKEFLAITSSLGIVRADKADIIKTFVKLKIPFRILTNVSLQNVETIKRVLKEIIISTQNCAGRHIDLDAKFFPRFMIRDEEEIIFFITPKEDMSITSQEDTGLWTNNKALIHAFKVFFEELWRNATDIQKKIVEIETGQLATETYVIKDAETAYERYKEIVGLAKEEIMSMTSPKGLIRSLDWPLKEWHEIGVSIRIMAPITSENLKAAQELSKYCQIRHVPTSYIRTTIIDGKHLFLFKMPPPDQENLKPMTYFDNVFYTNDSEYVHRMKDMLNDIWNSSKDISAVKLESVTRAPAPTISPSDSVSTIVETMAKKDVGAVIIVQDERPLGIITEKDILNRVINAQKDPNKTYAKDIMTTPLITVDVDKTIREALDIMHNNHIRRLAVVRGENLAGLVTERRALEAFRNKNFKV